MIMNGKRIGRALDIGVTDDLRRMTGVYVDCGLKGNRFVPSDDVNVLGDVAIVVDSEGKRSRVDGSNRIIRAVSTDGRRVGAILGLLIDEEEKCVEALELSRGYLDDLIGGRHYVRQYTVGADGDEVIIQSMNDRLKAHPEGGSSL